MARHRARIHLLDVYQDAKREWTWFVNWWRFFRRYRRNRTNHWLMDPIHHITQLIHQNRRTK